MSGSYVIMDGGLRDSRAGWEPDESAAEEREQIEGKVKELREALEGDDLERIKQLSEEVQQANSALSQQLQAQEAKAAEAEAEAQGGESTEGEEEGDVVEGEFREA